MRLNAHDIQNRSWGNSRLTLFVAGKVDDRTAHNTQYRYMSSQQTVRSDHIVYHNVRHPCLIPMLPRLEARGTRKMIEKAKFS
jgi:hypothetical protein